MTIEYQKGNIVFMCDGDHCLEYIDTEQSDFQTGLTIMRRNGWKSVKADPTRWEHLCPTCKDEPRDED